MRTDNPAEPMILKAIRKPYHRIIPTSEEARLGRRYLLCLAVAGIWAGTWLLPWIIGTVRDQHYFALIYPSTLVLVFLVAASAIGREIGRVFVHGYFLLDTQKYLAQLQAFRAAAFPMYRIKQSARWGVRHVVGAIRPTIVEGEIPTYVIDSFIWGTSRRLTPDAQCVREQPRVHYFSWTITFPDAAYAPHPDPTCVYIVASQLLVRGPFPLAAVWHGTNLARVPIHHNFAPVIHHPRLPPQARPLSRGSLASSQLAATHQPKPPLELLRGFDDPATLPDMTLEALPEIAPPQATDPES